MKQKYKIPRHLKPPTRKLLADILAAYELEDHHFSLLVLAGEALDRCNQARDILDKEGLTVLDRYGTAKAHPAASIERDNRAAFARLMRELALDAPSTETGRLPRTAHYGDYR